MEVGKGKKENERKENARERVKTNIDWISLYILAVAIQAEKTTVQRAPFSFFCLML